MYGLRDDFLCVCACACRFVQFLRALVRRAAPPVTIRYLTLFHISYFRVLFLRSFLFATVASSYKVCPLTTGPLIERASAPAPRPYTDPAC